MDEYVAQNNPQSDHQTSGTVLLEDDVSKEKGNC